MRSFLAAVVVATTLVLAAPVARAITVGGRLDPAYGAALSTQTTQTSFDDNTAASVVNANGSELDAAYAVISGGTLHLFLAGDLASRLIPSDSPDAGDFLLVFIDSGPGGQTSVTDTFGSLTGLRFDAGFAPGFLLLAENYDAVLFPGGAFSVGYETLPGGGPALYTGLGHSTPGGPGTLVGGTNPFGIEAAIDCSDVTGVTAGCAAASGAGVSTGVEFAVPLAALANPTGCIKILAFVTDHWFAVTSNQALGPLPPGTCSLGPTRTVDFSTLAGEQWFTVCPDMTPARRATWGSVKSAYR